MDQTQPIIQYTTVSDSVYLWVKMQLFKGEFKPGEHIAQERPHQNTWSQPHP